MQVCVVFFVFFFQEMYKLALSIWGFLICGFNQLRIQNSIFSVENLTVCVVLSQFIKGTWAYADFGNHRDPGTNSPGYKGLLESQKLGVSFPLNRVGAPNLSTGQGPTTYKESSSTGMLDYMTFQDPRLPGTALETAHLDTLGICPWPQGPGVEQEPLTKRGVWKICLHTLSYSFIKIIALKR